MSNLELIGLYIQEELVPDISEHAVLITGVHDPKTSKIHGHSLGLWQRLRFRMGF